MVQKYVGMTINRLDNFVKRSFLLVLQPSRSQNMPHGSLGGFVAMRGMRLNADKLMAFTRAKVSSSGVKMCRQT